MITRKIHNIFNRNNRYMWPMDRGKYIISLENFLTMAESEEDRIIDIFRTTSLKSIRHAF